MNGDIGIIGLGRVGMSLYGALSDEGSEPAAAYGRIYRKEFGSIRYVSDPGEVVKKSDIIFLCMNDDAIKTAADQISQGEYCLEGKIFAHFSGLLSSDALKELKTRGAKTASVHPLQTFPTAGSKHNFYDIYYAFEGDDVLADIENVFRNFRPKIISIDAESKPAYHAAAVISSNLLCMLLDMSDRLLRSIGINEGVRLHKDLINTTVDNIMKNGIREALTGPAARGDLLPVKQHLDALSGDEAEIYRMLSLRAVRAGLADPVKRVFMENELAGDGHEVI